MIVLKPNETLYTGLAFVHQTRVRSQLIYCITLLTLVLALGSLPFLYTSISIRSMGIIQSAAEKTALLAPLSGRVLSLNLTDNQKVVKGATLLIIDGTLPKQQKHLLNNYTLQLKQQLQDAEVLIKEIDKKEGTELQKPKTNLYLASWQQYIEQFQNATNVRQQTERVYQRYLILYNKKVVTLAEFEQHKFNFEQASSGQQMVNKKFKNQWQIEANQYHNELRELRGQKAQLNEQVKQYQVYATLSGFVQNLTGLQKGSYVYANQKLGEISPDSTLLAYCYVKPSDIGLIKNGQCVRLQIDAFNHSQWGILTGRVIDISNDVIVQNQRPYFNIKCLLDKNYLQLKNGYKGYMKKGMTFRANFTIAKRSLYQLLYDKVDDWVRDAD